MTVFCLPKTVKQPEEVLRVLSIWANKKRHFDVGTSYFPRKIEYHRIGTLSLLCSEWEEVGHARIKHRHQKAVRAASVYTFSTIASAQPVEKVYTLAARTVFLFFVVDRRIVEFAVRLFFEGRLGAAKAARAEARVQ